MAIDFFDNSLGKRVNAATFANDVDAWYHINTPRIQRKIIKQWIQDDQLLSKGVNANGEVIGVYSFATELITEGRKPQGENYNLFESGDLFASMFIVLLFDRIEIQADDGKIRDQDWYTEKIFELTDENLAKYIEEAKEGLRSYIRKILQIT
jgi:hypothetical protein